MKKSFFITCAVLSLLSSIAEAILFFTLGNSITWIWHLAGFAPICAVSYFLMAFGCSKKKKSNVLFSIGIFISFIGYIVKIFIDFFNILLIFAFSTEWWQFVLFFAVIIADYFFNYLLTVSSIFIGLHYIFKGKIFKAKLKNAFVILRAMILTVFSAFGITLTILGYPTAIPSFYLIINILSTIALICHKPYIAPPPSENNTVEVTESSAQ